MTSTSRGAAIVDMLLNALASERHVRRALLMNLVDELSELEGLEPAAAAARELFDLLETGPVAQAWFTQRIAALHELVRALRPRPSGVVDAEPPQTESRYSPASAA